MVPMHFCFSLCLFLFYLHQGKLEDQQIQPQEIKMEPQVKQASEMVRPRNKSNAISSIAFFPSASSFQARNEYTTLGNWSPVSVLCHLNGFGKIFNK